MLSPDRIKELAERHANDGEAGEAIRQLIRHIVQTERMNYQRLQRGIYNDSHALDMSAKILNKYDDIGSIVNH